MRSVLISVDFVYKQDGTLHPTELNTSTKDDLTIKLLTNSNFLELVPDFFEHEQLNTFMNDNKLSKIITIAQGGYDRLFKAFSDYYGFEYESIIVGHNQIIVPDIEDKNDTLIIRIAYDTYALIDDLYARDNYEFHNLIKGESFSSPVTFGENDFDTITDFELSQDGKIPNYIVKARTPGYIPYDYPKGYRFDNIDELNILKENLKDTEFIAKYEFNSSLGLIDNRTHHLRTMSLIYGPNLETMGLIYYKSLNYVSTQNKVLKYNSEIGENKKLNDLYLSKYYPTWYSKTGLNYHAEATDYILKPDNTTVSFSNLRVGDAIKSVFFNSEFSYLKEEQDFSIFETPILDTSSVAALSSAKKGIVINITASHETYGTFSWNDGAGNTYIIRKSSQNNNSVFWTKAGLIEIGDKLMIYDNLIEKFVELTVQDISYEIKDSDLYLISLDPKPEFFVQLDSSNSNLFLVQHNACIGFLCGYLYGGASCSYNCGDCGKNTSGCINCGGGSTAYCPNNA